MHANKPGDRKPFDVGADLLNRIDPIRRVDDVLDGLLGTRWGYTVKQNVPADFGVGVVVDHRNCRIWQGGKSGARLEHGANPAIVGEQFCDQVFADPVRAVLRMLEFVDGHLTDFVDGLAGQHGNASKGAIAIVGLLNSGECGFERGGSGVGNARHGASPDEWLKNAHDNTTPAEIGRIQGENYRILVASAAWQRLGAGVPCALPAVC